MTDVINNTNSSEEESQLQTLSEMFDKCLQLWNDIEETDLSTSDKEYQNIVKKAIVMLENVTHMVNRVDMFSLNESIEEVSTANIKFLILPALLGYFNLKIQPSTHSFAFRFDQLSLAEEYFRDFLKRCQNYEVPDVDIPPLNEDKSEKMHSTGNMNFQKMTAQREAAIARYKKTIAMDKKLAAFKGNVPSLDDEALREYHMLLLRRWVFRALEEMHSIEMEKAVVQSAGKHEPQQNSSKKAVPVQPLKPIILVRTELQKKVFGAGYPSIPLMTVDEFYQQRYPDADNEQASSSPLGSLQQMAADPEAAAEAKESEDAEEEEKIEKDDPEFLAKTRAFDDWKDGNK